MLSFKSGFSAILAVLISSSSAQLINGTSTITSVVYTTSTRTDCLAIAPGTTITSSDILTATQYNPGPGPNLFVTTTTYIKPTSTPFGKRSDEFNEEVLKARAAMVTPPPVARQAIPTVTKTQTQTRTACANTYADPRITLITGPEATTTSQIFDYTQTITQTIYCDEARPTNCLWFPWKRESVAPTQAPGA